MIPFFLTSSLLGCGSMSLYITLEGAPVQRYRVTSLGVVDDPDPDGDGSIENHLPRALASVAAVLPDQGLDLVGFNDRVAETIEARTPLFVDAAADGLDLVLTVGNGHFDAAGWAIPPEIGVGAPLVGTVDPSGAFWAGPGDLVVDVALAEGFEPVPFELLEVTTVGTLGATALVGTLQTLVSIQSIVDDVIGPTIPPEGWDIDGDGVPESRSEVLALIDEIAPLAADSRLADGSLAITATLSFAAEALPPPEEPTDSGVSATAVR